jgi:hypothetical protein
VALATALEPSCRGGGASLRVRPTVRVGFRLVFEVRVPAYFNASVRLRNIPAVLTRRVFSRSQIRARWAGSEETFGGLTSAADGVASDTIPSQTSRSEKLEHFVAGEQGQRGAGFGATPEHVRQRDAFGLFLIGKASRFLTPHGSSSEQAANYLL